MSKEPEEPASSAAALNLNEKLAYLKPRKDLMGPPKSKKKIFTPNLNVKRSKDRGTRGDPIPGCSGVKKYDDWVKKEEDRTAEQQDDIFIKQEPNIIISTGIFSEGVACPDPEPPFLQKPCKIRVKTVEQIDKELDNEKLKALFDEQGGVEINCEDFQTSLRLDTPLQLPMGDAGVPTEPDKLNQQESLDHMNTAAILQSGEPVLILVQLPDILPGSDNSIDDYFRYESPGYDEPSTSTSADYKAKSSEWYITDLEEGLIANLLVHRSGKITFKIGEKELSVKSGVIPAFQQEVVTLNHNDRDQTVDITVLGSPQHKLVISPDWDKLLYLH